MSFLPALTRWTSASPLMRHSGLIVAISRQVSVTNDLSMIRKSGNRFSLATNAERVCAEIMI